ncbi:hypothetical protein [Sideroxydans lithotrophicus]|uniref:DUF1566 domain-containing protein n=1 Tax=Sideroxydans lithotrophicus (strain ES-1) TaxID=580332 RepID=D5CUA8_SIDLE|nr:hypothetical protein [Sideroxydans lithotrophicus]ADE10443.1 conserved hypothetical protein [Sideroxydans lithotrophicus ES-1]
MSNAKKEFLETLLQAGEQYAGLLLGKNGDPDQHIILRPGEAQAVNWDDARKFATDTGGELPTRREQALLFANSPEAFTPNWYWSGEQRSAGSAWFQGFDDGTQYWVFTDGKCRAVAVRRSVAI